MRLGIHLTTFNHPADPAGLAAELAATGRAVEAAGAETLSVMDHYFQMEQNGLAEHPMLEGYTTLGFLAAHTSAARLGLLVTGVTYRHPGLLAKIVTTLDVLSGGRAFLGIGAAWYDREHRGLGVPYPATAERFERLEETLQICGQMWDPAGNGAYAGKHYQLAETLNSPPAVSSPRPRILIGGGGERKTLRLVAQYADACNLFAIGVEGVKHKLGVLDAHCADLGRDPAEVQRTLLYRSAALDSGDLDQTTRELAEYAALGISTVILVPPGEGSPAEWIERRCVPLAPKLAELG
ncbi:MULTISPECIES: LLM class F420-dependent oxidoreductase [unclassified Crossiella]|uniref:LLM class F420-dependent oxidoreductase n=1 Tax=unclassified Crossiella TaxID=2620835 RepID=UPI001FFFA675|nr:MULTISPECIES: LLM class F420-dependent oxidoreductase [unclassified Crossiella]MCK2241929.1 LLM class F420-dependent oxidoreductase [Crossiella sp. S99.2]MCK2255832.1 LLM class F420-dependent oxidoreductase [Crossiella sp. S99.1]